MSRTPSPQTITRLPKVPETWLVAVAQLRTWVTPPGEKPQRPYALFVLCMEDGAILRSDLTPVAPAAEQVRDVFFKAMAKPARGAGPARRPARVIVPPARAETLLRSLADARIEMDVAEREPPDQFWDIVRHLESAMRGNQPEHPGLLSTKGVTPELAGSLFSAAADFYHAAPWVQLSDSQAIAVRHPAEPRYRYAVIMGNAGVEYGLAMYLRWDDVVRAHMVAGDPRDTLPDVVHSITYDTITRLTFADLEAMEQRGWEVAAENAYPLVITYDKKTGLRPADLIDVLWYEAALRAIPGFVRDWLRPDGRGDYQPVETTLEVATHAGPLKVDLKYPAGELPLAQQPAQDVDWPDLDERDTAETDRLPFFDRRAMEGMMAGLAGSIGAEPAGDPELNRAQQLMYKAWEETNPARRLALAHEALSISPNCADAYVLLAEEEADTVGRALDLYEQGVAAGERALGPQYFREFAGDFWGLLETRPYMRALHGLADTLWRLHRREEALERYRDLLRLNPGDNQGVRYVLIDLLLQLERVAEAEQLLNQYRDDWSAEWLYTRALLEFRRGGASDTARKALSDALGQNPHAPAYLTGQKRIPNRLPEFIRPGHEDEAISYASQHLNHWRRTPGAVEWLKAHAEAQPAEVKSRRSAARAGRKKKR
jgi:tetratricopeptide (TPR) repeat protein